VVYAEEEEERAFCGFKVIFVCIYEQYEKWVAMSFSLGINNVQNIGK
jgi:hypothetical protein